MSRTSLIGAAVLTLTLAAPAEAQQKWGTVKGQVVWAGPVVVPRPVGGRAPQNVVVNPRNNGLKWVVVWLVDVDPAKVTEPIPTHPALAKVMPAKVELDCPGLEFEPHVVALRIGQSLVLKNSSGVPVNPDLKGGKIGPHLIGIVPPGKNVEVPAKEFKPRLMPIPVACSVNNWMKAYAFVFSHPYFAVTDADGNFVIKNAPQGKYRLVVWHEECGWVIGEKSPAKGGGKVIDIAALTDVGKIQAKPIE